MNIAQVFRITYSEEQLRTAALVFILGIYPISFVLLPTFYCFCSVETQPLFFSVQTQPNFDLSKECNA